MGKGTKWIVSEMQSRIHGNFKREIIAEKHREVDNSAVAQAIRQGEKAKRYQEERKSKRNEGVHFSGRHAHSFVYGDLKDQKDT